MKEIELIDNIDLLHKKANDYLNQKKLDGFMSIFSDELEYTQLNGKTINRTQLTKDQKRYFSRLIDSKSNYRRISFDQIDNYIEETLEQEAEVFIRTFLFFKKKWTISRKSIYRWIERNGELKINKVRIIEEKIT